MGTDDQVKADLLRILGPCVVFHYAVARQDLGMTYGLYDRKPEATERIQELVNDARNSAWQGWDVVGFRVGRTQTQADQDARKWANESKVTWLKEEQKYRPWGKGRDYIHGVNDGYHGSVDEDTF